MTLQNDERPVRGTRLNGCINTSELFMKWSEAPWDTAIFGYPVLQIDAIKIHSDGATLDMDSFEEARDGAGSKFVSCRLGSDKLRESMFLEEHGFRFIEMVYQPVLENIQAADGQTDDRLAVAPAVAEDMPGILAIAGSAFHNERFHVDHRLPANLGDTRYQNWVRSTLHHPKQQTYALRDGNQLVAFFVTEDLPDGTCYWHLNAVSPEHQGKGYGLRAWNAMIRHARRGGALRLKSSIVARNYRVLNLYSRLGFRFSTPSMTFHWIEFP